MSRTNPVSPARRTSPVGPTGPVLLAVGPNPSVDRVWTIPGFEAGRAYRVGRVWTAAGGKGCNVARVAADLGLRVVATGLAAGSAGDFIVRDLEGRGVVPAFFRLPTGETRTCPTIVDPASGRVTEIREPGPAVGPAEAAGFEALLERLLEEGPFLPTLHSSSGTAARPLVATFSGSLPPGLPEDFYAGSIRHAARRRVPCVLDASGRALALGIRAGPWAVKVNREELTGVRDHLPPAEPGPPDGLPSPQTLVGLLTRVVRAGVTFAVVTMGRDGLLAFDGRTVWRGELPGDLEVVQPVGSGDAATAALGVGLARLLGEGALTTAKWPDLGFQELPAERKADLVRAMVAAAAANAVTEGIGTFPREVFESAHRRVRVSAETLPSRN